MNNQQSSYKQIMKATSLFGGVQVFLILIGIVKTKFVAVLLGPAGMGVVGLLFTTTNLIASITNFGLGTSAVKNIAEANGADDNEKISTVVTVFRKLVWFTGLLGTITTIVLSPLLSKITFGNHDYTFAFIWISIILLFNQLSAGQIVLLQGMRQLKYMAQASAFGSLSGLLVSVPMYYFWGFKGIIPVIITTSVFSLILSSYFSSKVKVNSIPLSPTVFKSVSKDMLTMGLLIGLTGVMDQVLAFVTKTFINNYGNTDTVGLYDAAFTLINTYTGMIFTAMLSDYYPRLSSVAKDNGRCAVEINQQAEIAVLILAPLLILFMVCIKIIVLLLYSKKFIVIDQLIFWAMLGMLFKAINWAIGIIVLAKGDKKLYFFVYILAFTVTLISNIAGYYYFGLNGLGIAFFVANLLFIFVNYGVAKYNYSYFIGCGLLKIFLIQFILVAIVFCSIKMVCAPYNYFIGSIMFLLSLAYSYLELNKKIGIKSIIQSLKLKFKNN